MKINKIYLVIFIAALFAAACATVVPPDGGPKDNTPPVVLNYNPTNKTKNFKATKITIKFNEYIEVKELQSQMVVSPAMPELPEVYVKGKKLIIEPSDSLEPNTTYTIFLGNAIVNFTESLPIRNFQYVLSTGEFLDSLRISGVVKNAFDLKTEEGILVMLYKNTNDSAPYLKRPYYLAKTFGQGEFLLDNLSEGKYLMFALKDLNSNYLYDQPSEEIAFLDSLIVPKPAKPANDTLNLIIPLKINLQLFKESAKEQGLINQKVISPKKIEFAFRRNAENAKFELLNEPVKDWFLPIYSIQKDTVTLWITATLPDTLHLKISEENKVLDTVRLVLKKPAREDVKRGRRNDNIPSNENQDSLKAKPIERIKVTSNTTQGLDFFSDAKLVFLTPLKSFDIAHIQLFKLNDTIQTPLKFEAEINKETSSDLLTLKADYEESSNYKIVVRDSVFYDIFSHTNDSIEIAFSTTKKRAYGSLVLTVEPTDSIPIVIQLLNEKDVILQQDILSDSTVKYPYLKPGNYKIKAISDNNRNGKWDTGDYLNKKQPERVFYLGQIINVRANWDVEQKWLIE